MGKRNWIVLSVLVAAAVLVGWMFLPREPSYQGKSLRYWLEEYNRAGALDKTAPAAEAIRAMGTNALPDLMRYIRHKDSPLQVGLAALCRKHLFRIPLLEPSSFHLHSPAILALKELGPQAAPAIPELLQLFEAGDFRGQMGLLCLGPTAAPAFERACQNTNAAVREQAALMLAKASQKDRQGWSWGWNPSLMTGQRALDLGWMVAPEDLWAVKRQLAHPNAAVRRASAEMLRRYTSAPYQSAIKSARAALLDLLNDPEPTVREGAKETLRVIDADPGKAGERK